MEEQRRRRKEWRRGGASEENPWRAAAETILAVRTLHTEETYQSKLDPLVGDAYQSSGWVAVEGMKISGIGSSHGAAMGRGLVDRLWSGLPASGGRGDGN